MRWLQRWREVLFFHYPAAPELVERLAPPGLEIDTFEGQAWVSFVLFRLDLRPAWLPYVPGVSSLVELNLRTYVRHRGQSGICFLRMYADNPWAIRAARWLTPLDYRLADLRFDFNGDGCWQGGGESEVDALRFQFQVKQTMNLAAAKSESLNEWLLERYRLFVGGKGGDVIVGEVEHLRWEAARVTGEFEVGSNLVSPLLNNVLAAPVMHYSPGVSAVFHEFRTVQAANEFNSASAFQPAHAAGGRGGR